MFKNYLILDLGEGWLLNLLQQTTLSGLPIIAISLTHLQFGRQILDFSR